MGHSSKPSMAVGHVHDPLYSVLYYMFKYVVLVAAIYPCVKIGWIVHSFDVDESKTINKEVNIGGNGVYSKVKSLSGCDIDNNP